MEHQKNELDEWKEIRQQLNNNYCFSENWGKAVDLFQGRINKKYFKPVERLINSNLRKGEGFAIVTIQCALIEMFAAFREGQIYNHDKPSVNGISYEYKGSRDLFVRFLHSAEIFREIFQ